MEIQRQRTAFAYRFADYVPDEDDVIFSPEDISYVFHPDRGFNQQGNFTTPAVEALHKGRHVGFTSLLTDEDGPGRRGEISLIWVRPEYRHRGLADSMFDFGKQHEPGIHHSEILTTKGKGWSEHEKSRHSESSCVSW